MSNLLTYILPFTLYKASGDNEICIKSSQFNDNHPFLSLILNLRKK